mgnify:CR=1 FL=1
MINKNILLAEDEMNTTKDISTYQDEIIESLKEMSLLEIKEFAILESIFLQNC